MKKLILSIVMFAAALASATAWAEEGHIYEVRACTQTGDDIDTSTYPLWALGSTECTTAGQTAYFRIRLASPDDSTGNYWYLNYIGSGSQELDWVLFPPQICIFVSGEERWATLYDIKNVEKNNFKFTDLLFKYTTKSGDFSLPIVLGAKVGSKVKPATDPELTAPEYYLDLKGKWQFNFDLSATSVLESPNWWITSTGKGVVRNLDPSLSNARYNIQTVDFDSDWETNNVVWRSVHQDTTVTVGALPKLVRKATADEAVSLYVWSTNESAVVVTGPDVTLVESDPENHPGVKYHVAKVTIGASVSENATGSFTLQGVSQTSEDGWSGLVLSPYPQFNTKNSVGEYYVDYVTVPVRCVDPLPPSVMVTVEDSIAYATSDWTTAATRIKVSLSQPTSEKFKVRLNPAFSEDSTPLEPSVWGEYVRFSTSNGTVQALPAADPATTEVELGGGVNEAYVYLYALRGDSHTSGSVNQMEFQAAAAGSYPSEIEAFNKGACQIVAQLPVISSPEAGSTVEATAGEEIPMTIHVQGSYADAASDDGYVIYVKYKPTDTTHATGAPAGFVKIDGAYKPGDGGVLERCDDGTKAHPVFKWTISGEYETLIYVVAPVSGKKSCGDDSSYFKLNANITPTKTATISTVSGGTDFDEGDSTKIHLDLSEKYGDQNLWAFLKIETDGVTPDQFKSGTPYIIGMTNASGKCVGAPVYKNTSKDLPQITFQDGYGPATGDYLGVDFTVVLATVSDYTKATNENKVVTSYESNILTLTINNVEPTIDSISLNDNDTEGSEWEYAFKLPKSQTQELKANVTDPSTYDLNHQFLCQWVISSSTTKTGTYTQRYRIEKEGNPNDTKLTYNFPYVGWNKIVLKVKDKDMDKWSDAYTAYVQVLSKPTIDFDLTTVRPLENSSDEYVKVGLTYFDSEDPIYVMLTVTHNDASGDIYTDGELLLNAKYRQAPTGYESLMATNRYFITFDSEVPEDVLIARMDGTLTSSASGFEIKAQVINTGDNPKTGEPWVDYYESNVTYVYPRNVVPNRGSTEDTFLTEANTDSNRWSVAAGYCKDYPLVWQVTDDVFQDKAKGIEVSITGGGGSNIVCHTTTSGTFYPDFSGLKGDQQVTITVKDKDMGFVRQTWYFTVTSSKFLTTAAHGPGGGSSTIEKSRKYMSASGLGAGHVYVGSPASFDSASDFRLKWNCSSESSVPLYAWGYKTANPIDDGNLDSGRDQPLDKQGMGISKSAAAGSFYEYEDTVYDSFFYAWIIQDQTSSSSSSTSTTTTSSEKTFTLTISPEQPTSGASVGTATLPTTKGSGSDDSWPDTEAEAVFSKEYLWSDNMGDINADGIPDLYFTKYEFTETTETGTNPGGGTTTETTDVDDLTSLASYNKDLDADGEETGDFLPSDISMQVVRPLVPREFTAQLEVRGIGSALNDAPVNFAIARVAGVKPEIRYTDPDKDSTAVTTNRSTLTKLEFEAWCDYAAALGIADPEDPASWYGSDGKVVWSPERPSRPDLVDSDEDGFDDGYEYWYWYRAHVGYYDNDGVHRYQTGRRFSVRNPGQGILITSKEIEEQMDPVTPCGLDAKYQDSDNDGIPDILEVTLGTDPFDFDTDGDGLPDGWEIVMSGTDPCGSVSNAAENYDGDAMAITSPLLEKSVLPLPLQIDQFQTFAVIDANGDSAGVQWYATRDLTDIATNATTEAFNVIDADDGRQYATRLTVKVSVNQTLGNALLSDTYLVTNGVVQMPVKLMAGTKITAVTENVDCTIVTLAEDIAKDNLHACWVYGRDENNDASLGELTTAAASAGFLALGRNQGVSAGAQVCWLPSTDKDVAYLHYLVYQQFGFDPRTAWKSTQPLADRWTADSTGSGAYEGVGKSGQGGYTSYPTRTRDYTAYDEFLVMSFFVNNLSEELKDGTPSSTNPWGTIWCKYTTNPCGPGQTVEASDTDTSSDTDTDSDDEELSLAVAGHDDNGADTDADGVPDGWELYIMSGPKKDGVYVMATPYDSFTGAYGVLAKSYFSPFVAKAQDSETTNPNVVGITDNLTEFREFGGTDTIAYYTKVCSNQTATVTILRAETDAQWLNKFFPSDPWNSDTDGDGLADDKEGSNFVYGEPADDGKLWSIPGGGLNPCSVDTDLDGLPDAWEKQFQGKTVYAGDDAEYATVDGASVGNPLEGFVDGMDGTVLDAMNIAKYIEGANALSSWTWKFNDGRRYSSKINRDYDHDGLENWQEYLTGTMRCWRYDDPLSRWTAIPWEDYWSVDGWNPKFAKLGVADENEFWKETLFNPKSPIYNPHLVTDVAYGQYFSRVTNGWDVAYYDSTLGSSTGDAYYWFYHRIGPTGIAELWAETICPAIGTEEFMSPTKYACCSPISADTDQDGMDDYYELFHGMNPLLGAPGVLSEQNSACDVIAEVYTSGGVTMLDAWNKNYWTSDEGKAKARRTPKGNEYDFVAFPWLNGVVSADPDGDDIRNQQEAIMPMLATTSWQHTDPTPLWMTDSSYSNSLVNLFFRLPARFDAVDVTADPVDVDGVMHYAREVDGYVPPEDMTPAKFGPFVPDFWNLAATGKQNWMFSFEENEGYDSDHDGIADHDEATGKFAKEDSAAQDFDGPRHRQAMWFPGENAVLQTLPEVDELFPAALKNYTQEPTFMQFTVECWVKADESMLDDNTHVIVERPVWTDVSKPSDSEFIRRNFQLAVKDGKWYAMFEGSGTMLDNEVSVYSSAPATTDWTHLAVTYDCQQLTLYVNGEVSSSRGATLQPEYGSMARVYTSTIDHKWLNKEGEWLGNIKHEYPYVAILIGGSLKTQQEFDKNYLTCLDFSLAVGRALDLTQGLGWNYYTRFFKGYIDEVRIWDGARTQKEIRATRMTRADRDFALDNRTEFYKTWSMIGNGYSQYPQGCRRYVKDANGNDCSVPAELCYHFAFDSVPAAENAAMAAKVPHGYDAGTVAMVRPDEWQLGWWQKVLKGYTGTVYNDPRWVMLAPNTVAHLPRYDGTTLDSIFWSKDFRGDEDGVYNFVNVAEPVSIWTQVKFNGANTLGYNQTTSSRQWMTSSDTNSNFHLLYDFTSRHLKQWGSDLAVLGGAYARYADDTEGLWDNQGASSYSEITGSDVDNDGLPDWWESYAEENYRLSSMSPSESIGWNTLVNYHGSTMPAYRAYFRDMARGYYADQNGNIVTDDTSYRQTGDSQNAGIPDWWMRTYGILGETALEDHDNDGLSNYAEYLLSEVFEFNVLFDPTEARSVDSHTLDYFYRLNQLYVGEIFSDHDLVEDEWEDQYDVEYASRVNYDPYADSDLDGWSNRSEARYSNLCSPIVANLISHYTVMDGLTPDHPVPTLEVELTYNGANQQAVNDAQMMIEVNSDTSLVQSPDATYKILGKDEEEDDTIHYHILGKWSNRKAVGTLSPGNVNLSTLGFEFCADPSAVTYRWTLYYTTSTAVYSGSKAEYDAARQKYGDNNVFLIDRIVVYTELSLDSDVSETGDVATWTLSNGKVLGTVNLTTGEFILDLSNLKDVTATPTDGENEVRMEDQSFRIRYEVNKAVDLPRRLYLGTADEGYVREGKNTIIAWAETISANGTWDPGEPFGVATDVNIGWRKCPVKINLTDTHPVFARVYLDDACASDREYWHGIDSGNTTNGVTVSFSGGQKERVRVIRYAIDGINHSSYPGYFTDVLDKVVLDKQFDLGVKSFLHEGDFISKECPDIDWDLLAYDAFDDFLLTNVTYRIVLGNDAIVPGVDVTRALPIDIHRSFDFSRQIPTAVAPGSGAGDEVNDPCPTFVWTINGLASSYTAFRIVVSKENGGDVWDSGLQLSPAVDSDGAYRWKAPLFANDIDLNGNVFSNKCRYTWRVAMYNAKYRTDEFSTEHPLFLLNVQTNSAFYGNAKVAVKYYGPKESYQGKVIRVRAYESPDFTGTPVASGYLANPDDTEVGVSVTGKVIKANCQLIGIPRGSYYLQAFIDSNNNGECDEWESMGYAYDPEYSGSRRFNPMEITFADEHGESDLMTIYIEDADTDNDGLPDSWEYAKYGSITAKGVELVSELPAGEIWVNTNLTSTLTLQENSALPSASLAGRTGKLINNAGLLALALGASVSNDASEPFSTAITSTISEELVEEGVKIVSLGFDVAGNVQLEVEAEVETEGSGVMDGVVSADGVITVVCQLYRTEKLDPADWQPVGEPVEIEVGKSAAAVKIENSAVDASSGFYKITLEQK